ncbi:MAG: 3-hydroxybutyryl-CoA dehydrogenase [Dehalococcoidia bacterium]|nr:3-hydroxybutyryl-CoA dehydrogenase [Dehalococcoidia bacterium]
MKKVGLVGAGQMGSGIAQVCIQAGYDIVIQDVADKFVEKGLNGIKSNFKRAVDKGKMTAEASAAALSHLRGTTSLDDLKDRDLVIEAVIENMAEKKKVFAALDKVCAPQTILASNTSALAITEMAAATQRPQKVLGLHFFNPVPVLQLVEIVRALSTSDETIAVSKKFVESLGKTPAMCKDLPGFIANRALFPYLMEGIKMLESGVATAEDIDNGCKLGYNLPMGPLAVCDLIGLDTVLFIANSMFSEFRDPKFAPPPLLARMVTAGQLGRKTGKGFFTYS